MFGQSSIPSESTTTLAKLKKLESIYNELNSANDTKTAITLILKHFYSLNETKSAEIVERLYSMNIRLDPDDMEDGAKAKFQKMLMSDPSLKIILDEKVVEKTIETIYHPLLSSEYNPQALALFDKFVQYACVDVPFNLMKTSVWIGGPDVMRSGTCHAYSLLGETLAKAHSQYLPRRDVELKDPTLKPGELCCLS